MPSVDELNERFAIPNEARFEPGNGGLTRLVLNCAGAEAHVYLYGAHVTHFQPAGQAPMLFTSSRSNFQSGKPIRGGIPVIFPWFGPRQDDPNAPMHGLVRTREWRVESVSRIMDSVTAQLTFASDDQTRAAWPHDFALGLGLTVGPKSLRVNFMVHNTSPAPFTFEEALHTYLALADVRQTTIRGLQGVEYLDKNLGMTRHTQSDEPLRLAGPTDRVYLNTQKFCQVQDHAAARDIWVLKDNSFSTVVWNPWSDKIGTMPDLDPQEWPRFVCVETCNVKENAVTLRRGEKYWMDAEIATECPDMGL
jgi:glucose-6-phosphate 1-epimerase